MDLGHAETDLLRVAARARMRLRLRERGLRWTQQRAEVLAALEFVDYVVLFDEDTPVELIKDIKPDIDVKGGDYNIEDMPEARIMRDLGGRVEIIPYSVTQSEAFSTTQTIRRANNH